MEEEWRDYSSQHVESHPGITGLTAGSALLPPILHPPQHTQAKKEWRWVETSSAPGAQPCVRGTPFSINLHPRECVKKRVFADEQPPHCLETRSSGLILTWKHLTLSPHSCCFSLLSFHLEQVITGPSAPALHWATV